MKPSKDKWPSGPWHSEPDEKRWEDRNTSFLCLALRGPVGSWCGYVGVPEGHPAWGCSYYNTDFDLADVVSGKALREMNVQHQINEISVHGGLTYAGSDKIRGEDRYWFGFDCAHADDYSPALDKIEHLGIPTGWGGVTAYRDFDYVIAECTSLAEQIGAIRKP